MLADIIFIFYLIFLIIVCVAAIDPQLIEMQQEFLAFKNTQRYMHSKGLRWPPREWLD